ncbi:hypothetical protein HN425_03290, partial [Candidatus Woesearchaeota archaeon]|nr:hypothetical protein [Candidatus Woesearchaeota archaeon]
MANSTKWDLEKHFDKSKFEEQRKLWKTEVTKFAEKYRKDNSYLKDSKKLLMALEELEELETNYGSTSDEVYYYWLKSQKDQDDPKIKAKFNQIENFSI